MTRPAEAPAGVKRVLLLNSFGHEYAPFSVFSAHFREDLALGAKEKIDFYTVSLESARFADGQQDGPFIEYVRALFAERRADLVVTMGGPAARFVQRNRAKLFADTPVLLAAVDERLVDRVKLTDAVVPVRNDPTAVIEHIVRVLPETKMIAVVIGESPLAHFWLAELQREFKPLEGKINFIWLNGMSFAQMRERAANLPTRSAIFYALMAVDANGMLYEDEEALTQLRAVANAPIFGLHDYQLGRGIVGGPLMSIRDLGRDTAGAAMRIFAGEPPHTVQLPPRVASSARYDWRELQRWKIRESALPAGSSIEFRQPTFVQQYRGQIIAVITAFTAAGGLILVLLIALAKRRAAERSLGESEARFRAVAAERRQAEAEARLQRDELAHLSRVAMLGELSGSLAHELNQPLTAILSNAEAAQRFLSQEPANVQEVREILDDIVADDHRADEVIRRLRVLFKKGELQRNELDVNEAIREVLKLVNSDLLNHNVAVQTELQEGLPPVHADRVQVQQVLLNLVVNGCDAMVHTDVPNRRLTVRTNADGNGEIQVSVADHGCGIPSDRLEKVFAPFYTTKNHGMGLGLTVCRTIVAAHGGKLWATNNGNRGATFHVALPRATAGSAS